MTSEDIQSSVAALIALKQLYDTFKPKEEVRQNTPVQEVEPEQEKKKQELRKQAYYGLGVNGMTLDNEEY